MRETRITREDATKAPLNRNEIGGPCKAHIRERGRVNNLVNVTRESALRRTDSQRPLRVVLSSSSFGALYSARALFDPESALPYVAVNTNRLRDISSLFFFVVFFFRL